MKRPLPTILCLALLACCIAGCSGGGPDVEMVPVSGTVHFADGTVPQGEIATVNFEPIAGGPNQRRKLAFGEIQPDGSFRMTTVEPGDGVIAGKYKVVFDVRKNNLDVESLVPDKYTKPETTPIEVTVESGVEPFEFELDSP